MVSLSGRGLSITVWTVTSKKLLCDHVVIGVSFPKRGCSEGLQSSLLAKMFCEDVVIVVSLSERGLSVQCILLCFESCSMKMWSLWLAYQREGYIMTSFIKISRKVESSASQREAESKET